MEPRPRRDEESGFTLAEILVVILVIAALFAIALTSFLGQRRMAEDAEAKLVVGTARTAIESLYTESDSYAADLNQIRSLEPSLRGGLAATGLTLTSASDSFRVSVTSPTGNVFSLAKAPDGTVTRECTTADRAGCPADGRW